MVFSMLMDLVNMIFVGHLNDSAKVAGVGLGNMYVNIVSQSIMLGLNGAI
jgi:Na+-driven multidrug efflux pump